MKILHRPLPIIAAAALTSASSLSAASTVTWTGATNGTWDTATGNWTGGSPTASQFVNGDSVVFDDTGSNTVVSLASGISVGAITVNNSTKNYTFSTNGFGGTTLLKQGAGMLTLANPNTYSGGTTISAGTLQLNTATSAGTGAITLNDVNTGSNNTTLNLAAYTTYANAITVAAQGTGTSTIAYTGTGNVGSVKTTIALNKAATFTAASNGSYVQWGGVLTGSGQLTIGSTNGNRLIFNDGTNNLNASAFTGSIVIGDGTSNTVVQLLNAFSSGQNNVTVNANAILQVAYGSINPAQYNTTINSLDGSGTVNGFGSAATLTVGANGGNGNFTGTINNSGYVVTLVKNGTGTQTLGGANTYTGTTTVNGGTLLINGVQSTATGAITVASAATLGGAGTTGASLVTVNGNITGGTVATTGTLTANAVTLTASGHYVAQIDSSALTADKLAVSGALSLTAGSVLDLTDLGSGTVGDGTKLLIASYGSLTGVFNNYTDGQIVTLGSNQWRFAYNDGNAISLTSVPEPGAYGLLGAGALAGMAFVRRRRRVAIP